MKKTFKVITVPMTEDMTEYSSKLEKVLNDASNAGMNIELRHIDGKGSVVILSDNNVIEMNDKDPEVAVDEEAPTDRPPSVLEQIVRSFGSFVPMAVPTSNEEKKALMVRTMNQALNESSMGEEAKEFVLGIVQRMQPEATELIYMKKLRVVTADVVKNRRSVLSLQDEVIEFLAYHRKRCDGCMITDVLTCIGEVLSDHAKSATC